MTIKKGSKLHFSSLFVLACHRVYGFSFSHFFYYARLSMKEEKRRSMMKTIKWYNKVRESWEQFVCKFNSAQFFASFKNALKKKRNFSLSNNEWILTCLSSEFAWLCRTNCDKHPHNVHNSHNATWQTWKIIRA